ncbi:MAG: hypothetical protein P4L84_28555 [Isosphaeraceae bacterium]|nr:hypothetical protein [Isosphaeraceae bacterium]
MVFRLFLSLSVVGLIGLGLADRAPMSAWGLTEVSSSQANDLIGGATVGGGGAACGYKATICNTRNATNTCPATGCVVQGTKTLWKVTKQAYCGCSKSCSTDQYYQGVLPCATTSSSIATSPGAQ